MLVESSLWGTLYSASLVASVVSCLLVAGFALRNRFPGHRWMTVLFGCMALWSGGTFLALFAGRVDGAQVLLNQVQMSAIAVGSVGFLLFVYFHSGFSERVDVPLTYPAFLVPAASVALIWTNPIHGLVWNGFVYEQTAPVTLVSWGFQGWFWIHYPYVAAVILAGCVLLSKFVVTSDMYVDQSVAVGASAFVPLSVYALDFAGVAATAYPLAQSLFWVSASSTGYAVLRADLFENAPVTSVVGRDRLVRQMRDGAAISNASGTIVEANEMLLAFLGLPRRDVVGRDATAVFPVENPGADCAEVAVTVDGEARILELSVSTLSASAGTEVGKLFVFRDVTTRERRNQQMEALNRILRHDLRNHVSVAEDELDYVLDAIPEEHYDVREAANRARSTLEKMTALRTKTRNVKALFEGRQYVEFDVYGTIDGLRTKLRDEYPDVRIDGHVAYGGRAVGVPGIQTALWEVLDNACRHNPGERPLVRISSRATHERIEILVEDDGPGIPAEEQAILERAQRERQLVESRGIGLWITQWTLSMAGGDLDVDGTDEGTRVTLAFQRPGMGDVDAFLDAEPGSTDD